MSSNKISYRKLQIFQKPLLLSCSFAWLGQGALPNKSPGRRYINYPNELSNDWVNDWMTDWLNEWMNKWTNERTYGWINERIMNEWTNQSINPTILRATTPFVDWRTGQGLENHRLDWVDCELTTHLEMAWNFKEEEPLQYRVVSWLKRS